MTTIDTPVENRMQPGTIRETFGPLVMERFGVSPEEFLTRYATGDYESLHDEAALRAAMLAPFALTAGHTRTIIAGCM
jgi:hypothetical protein